MFDGKPEHEDRKTEWPIAFLFNLFLFNDLIKKC